MSWKIKSRLKWIVKLHYLNLKYQWQPILNFLVTSVIADDNHLWFISNETCKNICEIISVHHLIMISLAAIAYLSMSKLLELNSGVSTVQVLFSILNDRPKYRVNSVRYCHTPVTRYDTRLVLWDLGCANQIH